MSKDKKRKNPKQKKPAAGKPRNPFAGQPRSGAGFHSEAKYGKKDRQDEKKEVEAEEEPVEEQKPAAK
ncbi:MAG: hypothetical protein AABZ63_04560 [Actinomycetota bacterium]